LQAILGIAVLVLIAWALQERRAPLPWRVVLGGLGLQLALAALLVHVAPVREALLSLNVVVQAIDNATRAGTSFVFGFLGGDTPPFEVTRESQLYVFAFRVLPQVLVFSVLAALGWYWRVLPWMVRALGSVLERTLGVGGAVGLGAGASVFLGMVEAPLAIRPLIVRLHRSELFVLMSCGMATVAGSVMLLYASVLSPVVEGALGHLLVASVISAPAAIMVARLMVPGDAITPSTGLDDADGYASSIDAITRGTGDGLRLVANILAMLIVLVSLVALVNQVFGALPEVGGEPLTLQRVLGWLFAPIAWLIGVPWSEALAAGSLLGTKLILNELVAYLELAELPAATLGERSRLILTYALCGFANFGSLGIMIGGLSTMCPERRDEILELAPRTLISGTLATLLTGAVIGLVDPL